MFKLDTIHGKFIKYTLLLLIVPSSIFLISYFYSLRKDVIADAYTDISDEVTNQQTAISGWLTHHQDLAVSSSKCNTQSLGIGVF